MDEPVTQDGHLVLPTRPPETEPQVCGNCRHWDRRWPKANVAECQLSRQFLASAAITTDLQTCSQWKA